MVGNMSASWLPQSIAEAFTSCCLDPWFSGHMSAFLECTWNPRFLDESWSPSEIAKAKQRSGLLPVFVDVIDLGTNEQTDVVAADCDQQFVTSAIERLVIVSIDLEKPSEPGDWMMNHRGGISNQNKKNTNV